jgi:hypothetical protein
VDELFTKLFAVHDSLADAGFRHAAGGAIALAYCIKEPRGTRDLDINVFVDASRAREVLEALPGQILVTEADIDRVSSSGQTRLHWGEVPVDIFLNNHDLHDLASQRVRWVPLGKREIPVLDCTAVVVFKALFNRTKDWADIEAIADADQSPLRRAIEWLIPLVDDPANDRTIQRLEAVLKTGRAFDSDRPEGGRREG